VHAAGSTSRESLFNLALCLNESISEMIFLSSLRKFGFIEQKYKPSLRFCASSFWPIISMASKCRSMYCLFLFQEGVFNLLTAAGASFSRLLLEEAILCGAAYAWLVLSNESMHWAKN
jgi:hypothetical protein